MIPIIAKGTQESRCPTLACKPKILVSGEFHTRLNHNPTLTPNLYPLEG